MEKDRTRSITMIKTRVLNEGGCGWEKDGEIIFLLNGVVATRTNRYYNDSKRTDFDRFLPLVHHGLNFYSFLKGDHDLIKALTLLNDNLYTHKYTPFAYNET